MSREVFEDSMPEPEWIYEMTDIANKYIQRFKLANKMLIECEVE